MRLEFEFSTIAYEIAKNVFFSCFKLSPRVLTSPAVPFSQSFVACHVLLKDVVLAEKPLISEETDLIEPTLLDELICHIASLASVYHKPPNSFIEGEKGAAAMRKTLHKPG